MASAYLLKIRGGVEVDSMGKKAGKGPLIQEEISATLGTSQDQYLFQPVAYSGDGKDFGVKTGTITGDHESRITDYTNIICMATQQGDAENYSVMPFTKQKRAQTATDYETRVQGKVANTLNTFDEGDVRATNIVVLQQNKTAGQNDSIRGDTPLVVEGGNTMFPEKTGALCASNYQKNGTQEAMNGMYVVSFSNEAYDEWAQNDKCSTLKAAGGIYGGGSEGLVAEQYIVRRLTPTECQRLQGFPDGWGIPDHKDDLTDEEYAFWLDVRNVFAEVNGRTVKQYTKEQMLAWYNKLHTDGAEYKMWGNGISLPTAMYVLKGIALELEADNDE